MKKHILRVAVAVIILSGLAAGYMLTRSQAVTPPAAGVLEPEKANLSGTVNVVNDTRASGSLSLRFGPLSQPAGAISLDPGKRTYEVNPLVWGIGSPGREIWQGNNATVEKRIAEAKIKIVRIGGVQNSNLYLGGNTCTSPTQCNFEVMDRVVSSVFRAGAEPLYMFATYPGGFAEGDWNAYAEFMKTVVHRYNVDKVAGQKIRYWEVWNEPSDPIDGQFSKDNYMAFVRTVAAAMKSVDPSIKIVGPAMSWANLDTNGWVHSTATQTNNLVDVLSWHNYGTHEGSLQARIDKETEQYFNDIQKAQSFTGAGGKKYGAAITEYNMAWQGLASGSNDAFHSTYNATYAATAIINFAKARAELCTFFTMSQQGANLLGVLNNTNWEPYKPYYALYMFGNHTGSHYISGGAPSGSIDYLASVSADGKMLYIVAVNKNVSAAQNVAFVLPGARSGMYARYVLDNNTNPTTSFPDAYTGGTIQYTMPPASMVAFDIPL